jgi:hypothetical protein
MRFGIMIQQAVFSQIQKIEYMMLRLLLQQSLLFN